MIASASDHCISEEHFLDCCEFKERETSQFVIVVLNSKVIEGNKIKSSVTSLLVALYFE